MFCFCSAGGTNGNPKALNCLVVTTSHFYNSPIRKLVSVVFPDFDDLVRIRALGSLNYTEKPISLLRPEAERPIAMLIISAVKWRL